MLPFVGLLSILPPQTEVLSSSYHCFHRLRDGPTVVASVCCLHHLRDVHVLAAFVNYRHPLRDASTRVASESAVDLRILDMLFELPLPNMSRL